MMPLPARVSFDDVPFHSTGTLRARARVLENKSQKREQYFVLRFLLNSLASSPSPLLLLLLLVFFQLILQIIDFQHKYHRVKSFKRFVCPSSFRGTIESSSSSIVELQILGIGSLVSFGEHGSMITGRLLTSRLLQQRDGRILGARQPRRGRERVQALRRCRVRVDDPRGRALRALLVCLLVVLPGRWRRLLDDKSAAREFAQRSSASGGFNRPKRLSLSLIECHCHYSKTPRGDEALPRCPD